MKKITIVMQLKDLSVTLERLRGLGLLHVEHENLPRGENIAKMKEDRLRAIEAMAILPDIGGQKSLDGGEGGIVTEILDLVDEKETLAEKLHRIKHEIMMWEDWGDFDSGIIEQMANSGVWIKLCKITPQEKKNIPEGVILEELARRKNIIYCVAISENEIKLPFETLTLPEMSLGQMIAEEKRHESRIKEIEKAFLDRAVYKNALGQYEKYLDSAIEFNEIAEGAGRFEKLSYVKGYCPVESVGIVEKAALKEKWAMLINDPDESEAPPTLIKNPKWVSIIEPMFNIINTVPGYREIDISPHFLIFFSIFFGMLIGDAGYGLVYFIIGLIMQRKFKQMKDKSIFFLTYVLSSFAIIWGLMTGVFFGPHVWLKPMVPYFADNTNVQAFCFLIGAMQLTIAHIWKILRKIPSIKALSDVGWICILWAAYFMAKTLILNFEFPGFMKWIFIAGSALVILFTSPMKNILAGIGAGLGDFLLKLVNSFADIVSYIRLFAVGLAGVAIADAFNQIAGSIGTDSILNGLFTVLVLFAGHTLNLVMGILAILVHGVRLNVLEFSGHLDMEWSGVKYAPFKTIK
ncbi:MAG: V-type ATPase 116kDa subunit family protein [Candidatus Omnitrophota bacterium]|nr:V-type ATPase 116kDa subunit family protein [Candidatus Omnitrophota bacterium]